MKAGECSAVEPAGGAVSRSRRRDLIELAIGYAMILLVLWTPRPWQQRLYVATAVVIAVMMWRSFPGWSAFGLRATNVLRSMWIVGAALLAAAVLVGVAIPLHTLNGAGGFLPFVRRYWGYAIWAFAQQLLLQDFFLRRVAYAMPGRQVVAAAMTAGIFALAHLPNPILAPVTFVWGLIACLVFLHYRNLIPLGIAHAILGIALAATVPGPVTHNMRVGLGFLRYHGPRHGHHRSQMDQTVSTQAWVMDEAATRRWGRESLSQARP
jgi:membrane protease YdiL (CAAX protease family)